MMPVPTHLAGLVVPRSDEIDESALDATVRCPCGGERFELLTPGHTHPYQGETIPCVAEIDGKYFFLVKARCTACQREHLLLDADFHGWNGFVCHDAEQAALPRPPLVAWSCLACSGTEHEASIQVQTEGSEDFAELEGEFDLDRWPDGFGWFSMDVRCTACGKHTPEWISYETM